MKEYFKQFTMSQSGTETFSFVDNVNGRRGIVISSAIDIINPIKLSLAYFTITGINRASNITLYWDRRPYSTDYSNLDEVDNVEKLDFASQVEYTATFDITKVLYPYIEDLELDSAKKFIIAGDNIPDFGVTVAINLSYDYFRCVNGLTATVPFELKTSSGIVDLSDGSVCLSHTVNNGFGRVPATVKYIYDSTLNGLSDIIYLDNNGCVSLNYKCGQNFKLNFQQYIFNETLEDGFMTDGKSVSMLTWVNAQSKHILFFERFYAQIDGVVRYFNWVDIEQDASGAYYTEINGTTYPLIHEYICDFPYTLENKNNEYEIKDISDDIMTFESCNITTSSDVTSYRLKTVKDNYGNQLNVSYNNQGDIISVCSVGGNTVNIVYGDNGLITQINDVVSAEKTISTNVTHSGTQIISILSPQNNSDLYFTYNGNKIETMLDSIGNGYNLVNTNGKVTAIKSIAKTGGISNNTTLAFPNNNNTTTISGIRYKYINLYEISYAERYAKLTEKRNNKSNVYLFDYFGRNINAYSNNYDGEGFGNPQSEAFSLSEPALTINTENVFNCNDLCRGAQSNRNYFDSINDVVSSVQTVAMQEFINKITSASSIANGSNVKVYYCDSDNQNNSIDLTLQSSAIDAIKQSTAENFIVSAWALAQSFPFVECAKGYLVRDPDETFNYNTSLANHIFYRGLGYPRDERTFELYAKVKYGEGYFETDTFSASFDYNNTHFQQLQIPIRLRSGQRNNILEIKIGVNYANNNGTVYLYGACMKAGNWKLSNYNDQRFILYSRNVNKQDYETEYLYNDSLLPLRFETSKVSNANIRYSVNYEYNENKSVVNSIDSKGFVTDYTYNAKGDLIKTKNYRNVNMQNTSAFVEENSFDQATGFNTQTFNPFGVLMDSYSYFDGVLKTATPALMATVNYEYDQALNLVTEMQAQVPNDPITTTQTYYKGENTTQTDSGVGFRYDYDGFGRVTKIYIDNEEYCSVDYVNQRQKIVTYANGEREKINMNNTDTHADIYYTTNPNNWGSTKVEMTFSKYGDFKQLEDNYTGGKVKASYDDSGMLSKVSVENKNDRFYEVIIKNEYDESGRLKRRIYEQENNDFEVCDYTYQDQYDGKITNIQHEDIDNENISYDDLERVSRYSKSGDDLYVDYTYVDGDNQTTSNLIQSETFTSYYDEDYLNDYQYTYDTLGRLIQTENNGVITKKYYYDLVGRLIREDNRDFNKTFEYVYDTAGNILTRNEYAFTLGVLPVVPANTFNYAYDTTHKNRLLSYNGEVCNNYVLGNPEVYRGKACSWTNVHRLASFDGITFDYDYAGIRTKKTVNGVTTKFGINGSTIVSEQKGTDVSTRIIYYYGFDGITAFKHNRRIYYYEKNFLGDIIGIYDLDDIIVAKYVYDAWGNCKVLNPDGTENTDSSFIGNINPFRYRSYYFDVETNLYYLQSRYYDPQVGRFISMDQVEYIAPNVVNGLNLYAYCINNPVMGYDPKGTFVITAAGIVTAIKVVVVVVGIVVLALTLTGDDPQPQYEDDVPSDAEKQVFSNTEIFYNITQNKGNPDKSSLKIYNSWKYTNSQIEEFLNILVADERYSNINISRVKNEIIWHNVMYGIKYNQNSTASADVYFNSDDEGHGFGSWIMNNLQWFD